MPKSRDVVVSTGNVVGSTAASAVDIPAKAANDATASQGACRMDIVARAAGPENESVARRLRDEGKAKGADAGQRVGRIKTFARVGDGRGRGGGGGGG